MIVAGEVGADEVRKRALFPIAVVGTATVLVGAVVFWTYRRWNFDDGYIVFRYVENLRHGHGWAFNWGESWNASTSVLNPLLTWLASLFVGNVPLASHLVGGLSLAVGAVAVSWLFLRDGRWLPGLAIPLVAVLYPPLLLTWGLETYLFLGLILLYLALEAAGRRTWLLVGFLCLARPDGALFGLLKVLRSMLRTRRFPWRGSATAGAVILPWVLFSLWRFGSVVPDTFASKRQQGALGAWGSGPVYVRGLKSDLLTFFHSPRLLLAVAGLAAVGGLVAILRRPRSLADFGIFVVLQQLVYALLNPPYYHWYGRIFSFALAFYAVLGAEALAGLLPGPRLRVAACVLGGVAIAILATWRWLPRQVVPIGAREIAYERLARYVEDEHPQSRSMGATEAGVLGYTLPLRMRLVDFVGLTSPNPEYYTGLHIDRFYRRPPDLVVVHFVPAGGVWHFEKAVVSDPRFSRTYELERIFSNPNYTDLILYRRR
jgi:hypothetical protein